MTYMLLLNCALKLVEEIILHYDARSNKHKKRQIFVIICSPSQLNSFTMPEELHLFSLNKICHFPSFLFFCRFFSAQKREHTNALCV